MQIYNTKHNFGLLAIMLHWLMAIIIVGLFILGKMMHGLDYYDPNYHIFPWWHKSFGISIATLLVLRLLWKWINPTVQAIASTKPMELRWAKIVHFLLYALILICCVSGVMISTAEGAAIDFFGWFEVPALFSKGEPQAEMAGAIHEISTLSLILLTALHLLAALKHHFIDKDNTLKRMLFTKI